MQNKKIREIANIFKEYNNFIITSHVNLDGDALGSELALYFMLKQLQKRVTIINQDRIPYIYSFMPGIGNIICGDMLENNFVPKIKPETVLIVLDSSNLERIGNIGIDLKKTKLIVNIDHHPSNTNYGHINYIDTTSSSVGEIIFHLCTELGCQLTEQVAKLLYAAIITDTGSFRYANTRAETFHSAYLLAKAGANPHLIANYIYNNNELSGLKLLGEALLKLQTDLDSKISWTIVTREMIEHTCAKEEETEGIVDRILSIKCVQVSVLFRETGEGKIKISFRSKGEFNVDCFAKIFGGGGHPNAAGCQLEGNIHTIVEKIVSELKRALDSFQFKYNSQSFPREI